MSTVTLSRETPEVKYLCNADPILATVINAVGELTYQAGEYQPYRFLISTIVGQMLSNKVADVLNERMMMICKNNIDPQTISALSDMDLKSIGISGQKIRAIRSLTNYANEGKLRFDELVSLSDDEVVKALTAVKGIGNWTAKMYLLFAMNRNDILPFEDGAFMQAFRILYGRENDTTDTVKRICYAWKPYSSIAARYLYRALDSGVLMKK